MATQTMTQIKTVSYEYSSTVLVGVVTTHVISRVEFQNFRINPGFVDFAHPADDELKRLAEACQPATFGVNQQDVLDEAYRKAGKMDSVDFSTQFHPAACGVVDAIRDSLLGGKDAARSIKIELYKLNVYGPGAFFKSHVDTPRSDSMFGSLVVVLPTVHEGGSLLFRHRGHEWTFDSANAVSTKEPFHAAFVAFFGDVEHEVSLVTSGFRVTITYNLYFSDSQRPALPESSVVLPNEAGSRLQTMLSALLDDPNFLPQGGLIGFGLFHKYPFKYQSSTYPPDLTKLADLKKRLKGPDAVIRDACKALQLDLSLKAMYRQGSSSQTFCLLDSFVHLDSEIEEELSWYLHEYHEGTRAYTIGDEPDEPIENLVGITWITPVDEVNVFEPAYIVYGNEASLGYAYGQLCLVAKVKPVDKRSTLK